MLTVIRAQTINFQSIHCLLQLALYELGGKLWLVMWRREGGREGGVRDSLPGLHEI